MKRKPLNITLPPDLVRKVKIAALESDTPASVSTIIEERLREYLAERERAKRKKQT